jgi:ribose transport system ATP-binding protein
MQAGGQGFAPAIEATGLSVSFNGHPALRAVDLTVPVGGIVGIVGENGAGKSTLLNVLSGVVIPDRGELANHGIPLELRRPSDASAAGIFRIHQEQALLGQWTVAENLVLGATDRFRRGPFLARSRIRAHAQRVIDELDLPFDPDRLLRSYSFGDRQLVELARVVSAIDALEIERPVVLLDEPTAALSATSLDRFHRYLDVLRARRASIVFISHRLDECVQLCESFVILKDGSVVAKRPRGTDVDELHRLMVGRERADDFYVESRQRSTFGPEVLVVERASVAHAQDVSLQVRAGETVGLAGLPRSGKHDVGAAIFGAQHLRKGSVRINGSASGRGVGARIRSGCAYIPLHRSAEGIAAGLSVADNITLAAMSDTARRGVRRRTSELSLASGLVERLGIRCSSPRQRAGSLSGGNQQKVVFGRWLTRELTLLVADNPTRGVDAGAKEEIYHLLRDLTDTGVAVLVVSDDLPELVGLCNRIVVVRDGVVTAEVDAPAHGKPEEVDVVRHMV